MMSELRLRIDKYLEGDPKRPPHVFAKIYAISESGSKRELTRTPRQELIPISHLKKHTKSVQLEPGRYIVETVLPSGEILTDNVSLSGNETKDLIFRPEYSPREWLSWQHLVGNVQSAPVTRSQPRPTARRSGVALKKAAPVSKSRGKTALVRAAAKRSTKQPRELNLSHPIQLLSTPHPSLVSETDGDQVWTWLAQLTSSSAKVLVHKLNSDHAPVDVTPYRRDSNHALFRVSWAQLSSGVKPLKKQATRTPCFMSVPRRRSVELIRLPIPWRVTIANREAPIEIAIQEPTDPSGFCTSASAMDSEFGMLLGYLSSGSLPTAREMAETAKGMLYEKMENPFAAAAGAYALVGTALQASDREWHHWVENLMMQFPHIPDGAIQWGQLKLRMRRSSSDLDVARWAFKMAFKRGLPFYSIGMRWLVDGLEAISHDDPEAAEMLNRVRPISWLTHYQQPFTILKLGANHGV